jgi:hypothetical protein
MNPNYALKLSNIIHKYAKKYNQDPHISVAIAMQETSLVNKHRMETVVIFKDQGYEIIKGYTDLCIFQIHINTAYNKGLNILKLNNDLEYCVEQHFKIMKKKRKVCKKLEPYAWTCYHSYTESHRLKYKKLVERYL